MRLKIIYLRLQLHVHGANELTKLVGIFVFKVLVNFSGNVKTHAAFSCAKNLINDYAEFLNVSIICQRFVNIGLNWDSWLEMTCVNHTLTTGILSYFRHHWQRSPAHSPTYKICSKATLVYTRQAKLVTSVPSDVQEADSAVPLAGTVLGEE